MTFTRDVIETSYDDCRQVGRRSGSSFLPGFLLLPYDKRRAMEALYAFMRHTDDLADETASDLRRETLAAWRASLHDALRGELDLSDSTSRILPALADAVRRFGVPSEHLDAVIDGVEMDLDRRRYETFDELEPYCQRVASAVGLACIHVWGYRGPEALEPARQAGIAMQLTNILRDVKEDAALGRIYLPLADLRTHGYSVDDLLAGRDDARFERLMADEIARAERYYAGGAELIDWLEPSGRRIFGLMMATYHELLRAIARRPGEVLRRRVRLGRLQKLGLAARWSLLPPSRAALG